jgi:hypothetical protein
LRRGAIARLGEAGSLLLGLGLIGGAIGATTNWVVGLNDESSAASRSAGVSNLTVMAVATPSPSNVLFPGGTADVVATISNPNPFPVTVTGVELPANTSDATGFASSALSSVQPGCLATTPSGVTWNFATSIRSWHALNSPLTVPAHGETDNPLTVTFTNDAVMDLSSPAACEGTYFSMPSLSGIAASAGGSGVVTTGPAWEAWTN